jgi:hypothetical protein
MVRWHPLPPGLPETVADLKRALRRAIDGAGYTNLGLLAQSSGVPATTISDAASRATVVPSKTVLVKILRVCKNPRLDDSRYANWEDLHQQACAAAHSTHRSFGHTEPRKKHLVADESPASDERPPLAVFRNTITRKGRSETTEIFFYSEAAVQHLIDRHMDGKPAESEDEQ